MARRAPPRKRRRPAPRLRIERGTAEDAPTILALIRGLAEYERLAHQVKATIGAIRRHGFGPRPYFETLICRADGRPIGFALYFFTYSTFLGRPSLYLEDLFVRPEERGNGALVPAEGKIIPSTDSPIGDEDDLDTIEVSAGFSPAPGTLLLLEWQGGDRRYFQVAESERSTLAGSPPTGTAKLVGRAFSWSKSPPTLTISSVSTTERLSFELRVQRGDTDAVRILDLGFASTHSSFWNALPTDAQLFATVREDEYETLWDEADELRFPLAGDYHLNRRFIPIGMSALAEPTMAPQNSGYSALERDVLAVRMRDYRP